MKCWAKKENGSYVEIPLENNTGCKKLGNSNALFINTNTNSCGVSMS